MKTKHMSSEQNGISIAVDVGTEKPVYVTPAQLRGFFTKAPELSQEFQTWPTNVLDAIDSRAALTPEARALARQNAQRAKLVAAVEAAKTDAERAIAEMELKVFELKIAK